MALHYLNQFNQLNLKCKQFIFLYFLRSISAGVAFFIGIYLSHIHMKLLIIGYEVTALAAGYLIGSWLAAKLIDRINAQICSGISLFIQGLCFIAIAFFKDPRLLGLAVFGYGIAGYFYIAVSNYVITSYAKNNENRIYAISYTSIASNLGLLIGGILVSYLTKAYAPAAFTIVGLILLTSSWFYFAEKKEVNTIKQMNHNDETQPNQLIYFSALIITFLLGCIFAQQRIGYQVFLEGNFTSHQISLILGLSTALILLLLPYITKQFMQYNKLLMLGFGSILLSIGMYLAILSSNYYFILLLCGIRTLGEMIATVLSQYLCFQYAAKQSRGKAMGNYKLVFAFGILIGSFMGSNILDKLGINAIWDLCGVLGVLIFGTCLIVVTYIKQKSAKNLILLKQ